MHKKSIATINQTSNNFNCPRISIITPSFNQGKFIEETIKSVLDQKYSNLDFIIIDGASKDSSVNVIRKYEACLSHWESKQDRGQSHAINKGFRLATGDILTWLNSDDVYCPNILRYIGKFFIDNPQVMLLSGYCNLSDSELNIVGVKKTVPFSKEQFLEGGNVPGQPAIFFRKEILDSVGYLNENLHYVMDWEYWLRISMTVPNSRICLINHPLATARLWDQAKTTIAGTKSIRERESILTMFFHEWTQSKFLKNPLYFNAYRNLYKRYSQIYWQNKQYGSALSNLGKYFNFWCKGKFQKVN